MLHRALCHALVFTVLLLLAPPALAGDAAPAVAQGVIARAVAISRTGRTWGVGAAAASSRQAATIRAAQQAMGRCGRDCRVQFQSVNPDDRCIAVVRGLRGGVLIGAGPSSEAARVEALAGCRSVGAQCRIAEQRCL